MVYSFQSLTIVVFLHELPLFDFYTSMIFFFDVKLLQALKKLYTLFEVAVCNVTTK